MGHSALEIPEKIESFLGTEIAGLEIQLVLERSVIAERELLIPFFLTGTLLLLERIEPVQSERHVRERYHIGTVPGILAVKGIDREAGLGPGTGIGDGGRCLVRQRTLDRSLVKTAVRRTGKIHGCPEGSTGMSLGVLGMTPLDTEVLGLEEVRLTFLPRLVIGNVDIQ